MANGLLKDLSSRALGAGENERMVVGIRDKTAVNKRGETVRNRTGIGEQ